MGVMIEKISRWALSGSVNGHMPLDGHETINFKSDENDMKKIKSWIVYKKDDGTIDAMENTYKYGEMREAINKYDIQGYPLAYTKEDAINYIKEITS